MELISFISYEFSDIILEHYNTVKNSLHDNQKLLFVTNNKEIVEVLKHNNIDFAFVDISKSELINNCISIDSYPIHPNLSQIYVNIFCQFNDYDYYWFIENDVIMYNRANNNSFKSFFNYFIDKDYDVICDHLMHIMSNYECKIRYRYLLDVKLLENDIDKESVWKGFFTVCRFSNKFLLQFKNESESNNKITKLFFEIGLPTFAKINEFSIFSLDDNNLFSIKHINHPFRRPKFFELRTSVNTGSNSWSQKPYNCTNNYLFYHDNTIVHAIKNKNVELFEHEHYNEDNGKIKIWVCGNNFNLYERINEFKVDKFDFPWLTNDKAKIKINEDDIVYNKFDLSLKYSRYNINDYNRIFSEFTMMHYIYANNLYSKYVGTAHYKRYPKCSHIDFDRLDNGEIQYFCYFSDRKYRDIHVYNYPDFAFVEHQVNEFGGPDMLTTDMIEYLQSNKVIDIDKIIEYTKHKEFIKFYTREIFAVKWEIFCDIMEFVEGYIRFLCNKYNIYSLYDWIEHIKTNIIDEYRKPKFRTYFGNCYQYVPQFRTIYEATYGYDTSNCWRVYSYMIEMLISIYIGTHKNFYVNGSYYECA